MPTVILYHAAVTGGPTRGELYSFDPIAAGDYAAGTGPPLRVTPDLNLLVSVPGAQGVVTRPDGSKAVEFLGPGGGCLLDAAVVAHLASFGAQGFQVVKTQRVP